MVIQHAVCEKCRSYTNQTFENPALQTSFLVPRLQLELRRRKKSKKKALPPMAAGNRVMGGGEELFVMEREVAQYPPIFEMVFPEVAGKLAGIDRGGGLNNFRIAIANIGIRPGATGGTTRHPHDHTAFSKTLAKIAYCFACAEEKSLNGFDEIRELICGKRDDVYNFVGCSLQKEQLTNRYLHGLYLRTRGDKQTVLVHLFASCGMQPYEVVVGKAT
jgi:hypothetical protein